GLPAYRIVDRGVRSDAGQNFRPRQSFGEPEMDQAPGFSIHKKFRREGRRIPNPQPLVRILILAGRDESSAVRAERRAEDRPRATKRVGLLSRDCAPEFYFAGKWSVGLIVPPAGRGESQTVWAIGHAIHSAGVADEVEEGRVCAAAPLSTYVPDFHASPVVGG